MEAKEGKLSCEISERWIKFSSASEKFDDIEYLSLDIMNRSSSDKDKKLCEIIVDKQQLIKMLAELPVNDRTKT